MSFFIYVREENFQLAEGDREEQAELIKRKSTYRDVSAFFVCGKEEQAPSVGAVRLRIKESVRLCPHRLRTFTSTLVQLPAHAVCARCPRSGRKIGRWRQPERLSERPQGASCAEGSDRPFFQDADVGGCSFLCFVSCLSGQEGNEDSNAAQSYRRKIEK